MVLAPVFEPCQRGPAEAGNDLLDREVRSCSPLVGREAAVRCGRLPRVTGGVWIRRWGYSALACVAVAVLPGCGAPVPPTALPADCGTVFDFDAKDSDLLGEDQLLDREMATARGGVEPVTLGELTVRAGWTVDGWDRMVRVRSERASTLNTDAQVFDICWANLPKTSYGWHESSAQREAFMLFFAGGRPVQAVRFDPGSPPADFGVHTVFSPSTVMTPTRPGLYEMPILRATP